METTTDIRTPWQRVLIIAGTLGPVGYLPASGTLAVAVAAVPMWAWMVHWSSYIYVPFVVLFTFASVWLHDRGDRLLGKKDAQELVWDELAGFWVAIAWVPFTWQLALWAFFIQRTFDICKIPPANLIEKKWPGGWGVVGDDIVAGLWTLGVLHALMHFKPAWCGLPIG